MAIGRNNPEQNPYEALAGILITIGAFYGGMRSAMGMKTYEQEIKPELAMVKALNANFANDSATAMAAMDAQLTGQAAKVESQIVAGMSARGITDVAAQKYATGAYAGSISGAYAAANAALRGAEVNAGNALAATTSRYYQNVASMQLQSVIARQKAMAGIWGSLGGMAASAGSELASYNDQQDNNGNPQVLASDSSSKPVDVGDIVYGRTNAEDTYANRQLSQNAQDKQDALDAKKLSDFDADNPPPWYRRAPNFSGGY